MLPSEADIRPPRQNNKTNVFSRSIRREFNSLMKSKAVPDIPKTAAITTSVLILPLSKMALKKILNRIINEKITATTPLVKTDSA